MNETTVYGQLTEDYQLQIVDVDLLKRFLYKFQSKELEITISPRSTKRSAAQNRYYWGVAIPLIRVFEKERTGKAPSKNAVHAYNLMHVVGKPPVVEEIGGKNVVVFEQKTTSQMSVTEFTEFTELLVAHWAELGCEIPMPTGQNTLNDFI